MPGIKGTIVIGTARSGSHMTCDMLFNNSQVPDKHMLGEVTSLPNVPGKFVYCSIVQNWAKVQLATEVSWCNEYHVVNLRRRDKVAQYLSWCIFRLQPSMDDHAPVWDRYKNLLPWDSTRADIDMFLMEQYMDFAFVPDEVIYYEDIIETYVNTKFKKNQYPVAPDEIVTDYQLVKRMLENFSYDNR